MTEYFNYLAEELINTKSLLLTIDTFQHIQSYGHQGFSSKGGPLCSEVSGFNTVLVVILTKQESTKENQVTSSEDHVSNFTAGCLWYNTNPVRLQNSL